MGGIKLSVHPLFFVFGLFYALTGKIFVFIIYTVCAVVHELGHSLVASALGYRLNKITLMPFGAVVSGNIEGLKFMDEIKIALAGPIVNLATGILFVACWWVFPESYAFTDVAAEACFSMALINFLPIYPLDGGRVLWAGLAIWLGENKAKIICKITGVIFSALLIAAFIVTLFSVPNISLLLFALFVMFGALDRGKENRYVKIFTSVKRESLMRGMPCKKIALHKNASVKKLISMLDENAVNQVEIYDDDKPITVLSQKKIEKIIETGDIYSPIEKFLLK